MAPRARFELATLRLTAECSTIELPGSSGLSPVVNSELKKCKRGMAGSQRARAVWRGVRRFRDRCEHSQYMRRADGRGNETTGRCRKTTGAFAWWNRGR